MEPIEISDYALFQTVLGKYIFQTNILKYDLIPMLKYSRIYFCAHLVILVGIGAIRLTDGYLLNELNMAVER